MVSSPTTLENQLRRAAIQFQHLRLWFQHLRHWNRNIKQSVLVQAIQFRYLLSPFNSPLLTWAVSQGQKPCSFPMQQLCFLPTPHSFPFHTPTGPSTDLMPYQMVNILLLGQLQCILLHPLTWSRLGGWQNWPSVKLLAEQLLHTILIILQQTVQGWVQALVLSMLSSDPLGLKGYRIIHDK